MATFYGYVLSLNRKVDFEVLSKIRTDTHGHYTYVLKGEYVENGRVVKCSNLVNKDQWDRYDVPVLERKAGDARREQRVTKKRKMAKIVPSRNYKKVYDEEIEKWLLDHADMDLKALDSNGIMADE